MTNFEEIKAAYSIKKILYSLRSNEEIVFDLSSLSLLDLTRQYNNMPDEIRNISEPQLMESINMYIENSSLSSALRKGYIYDKYLKKLELSMRIFQQIKEPNYIDGIYKTLLKNDFIRGCIKNITRLIKNHNQTFDPLQFNILLELINFIVDGIIYLGYTKSDLYSLLNNIYINSYKNSSLSLDCYNQFSEQLLKKINTPFNNLNLVKIKIEIPLINLVDFKTYSLKEYFYKTTNELIKTKRIDNISFRNTSKNTILKFNLYELDKTYSEVILRNIYKNINSFLFRSLKIIIKFKIFYNNRRFEHQIINFKSDLNLKYFDILWKSANWLELPDHIYEELLKIDEWIHLSENCGDKRTSFMLLWSILEFILIGAEEGNKRKIIYENFSAYMGLFFLRKNIKVFFYKLLNEKYYSNKHISKENFALEFKNHIHLNLSQNQAIADEQYSFGNKLLLFLMLDDNANKWDGFDTQLANNDYIYAESKLILNEPHKKLETFEKILKTDIDQMYRLRNMLTHGGINDEIILDNTYARLKYYVQTLINTLSYTWLNNSDTVMKINEIHRLKKEDFLNFKKRISQLKNSGQSKNYKGWIELVDFKDIHFLSTPPNRFSWLGFDFIEHPK